MMWKNAVSKSLMVLTLLAFSCLKNEARCQTPNGVVVQYAGNIGMVSAGTFWKHGKNNRWETSILAGFVPKENETKGSATFTVKESLSPWNIEPAIGTLSKRIGFEPAVFSIVGNVITGNQYWFHEPEKYNKGDYYRFSSRARVMLGAGSRCNIFNNEKNAIATGCRSMSLYYELSTYDLAIRYAICNKSIDVFDIISLGVGIQIRFF